MDQRQLEQFVAVAEELSFTRAAQRLAQAQSTVSMGVRALERELETSLFERTTRVVTLTERGEAFLPEARAALASFQRARATVDPADASLRGTLAIGTLSGLSMIDVPGLVRGFRDRHPDVRLLVVTSPAGTRGLLEQLRARHIDVAFVGIPDLLATTDVDVVALAQLRLDVLVADDHPLARRDAVTIADLAGETFVDLPGGFGARTMIDAAFQHAGLTRRVGVEVADMTQTPAYVAAGLGIAITNAVPQIEAHAVTMVRLVAPELAWTLYVATPARRPRTRATDALIELLPAYLDDRGVF